MPDVISEDKRKARKNYTCDLCNREINQGETYVNQTNKYAGNIYNFKMHEKCNYIMSALWNYADPDDNGMDGEYFRETVDQYGYEFICPHCENYNAEYSECNADKGVSQDCINLIYNRLKKYSLKRVKKENDWMYKFVEVVN